MNPIMNIGQFRVPKLSLGLAIGLRLRLLIVRQSQTIKLVPHKKLWQWWCTAQSRVFNGVHSMCVTTATCWLCNSVQSVFRAFRMDGCQICHFMKNNSQRYIEQCTMVWLRANCQHSAGLGKNCIPFKNLQLKCVDYLQCITYNGSVSKNARKNFCNLFEIHCIRSCKRFLAQQPTALCVKNGHFCLTWVR